MEVFLVEREFHFLLLENRLNLGAQIYSPFSRPFDILQLLLVGPFLSSRDSYSLLLFCNDIRWSVG